MSNPILTLAQQIEITILTKEIKRRVPNLAGLYRKGDELEVLPIVGEFTADDVKAMQEVLAAHDAVAIETARTQQLTEARTELSTNEWTRISLAAVDAKIDAISNLADLKVLLKKLARYLIAKEVS